MAMVTAMVMAMEVERTDRRPCGLIRQSRPNASRRKEGSPGRLPWNRVLAGIGCVAITVPALADNWRITPSASLSETYTSNVNYTAIGPAESDFATLVTGTLQVSGQSARARLNGTISATGLFYVKDTDNNSFVPSVNLTGNLEAIEKFFFIDAQVNVTQTFVSPFGAQPGSIVNATNNRYTSQTYRISPYIQGRIGGSNVTYQVRDDNVWTLSNQFGNALGRSRRIRTSTSCTPASALPRHRGDGRSSTRGRAMHPRTGTRSARTRPRSAAPSSSTRSIRRCRCRREEATRAIVSRCRARRAWSMAPACSGCPRTGHKCRDTGSTGSSARPTPPRSATACRERPSAPLLRADSTRIRRTP